ncbi:hypothetical protein [Pseudobacteroides cellulosolvens]|uniref:Uncharacterized protein n=1 Tax=Pseudobacteroides cellulosolvens ATCC 35603 = DSM 2933 TaxID=398512 RepID=A0A0L6JXG2_9FIRM|nr:hypothetical protein [Pseudobacteroides cellulosolvens]KNY30541.1 hypothetical protein Bccel_5821 [Pseudobacteroides cellulosolvens ATCC 35603 = DSM 2933]KNY30548.1 hypothetical protein Bccel_5828 [Pseudobacteroides cellulosolvens ATCC 35603 = DSM 2933]
MDKTHLHNLHGFELILSIFVSIFVLSILGAWRSSCKYDSARTTCIIRLNRWLSTFLFLHVIKVKVTIWMVILQLINYIALIVAILIYKILDISSQSMEVIIVRFLGISFFATYGLFLVDFFITSFRKREF